uniref:Uncharacterized protein n=1 Tax=Ditylenchus dipsaci TaxID=166011 RepID=A0A915E4P8_9BILA
MDLPTKSDSESEGSITDIDKAEEPKTPATARSISSSMPLSGRDSKNLDSSRPLVKFKEDENHGDEKSKKAIEDIIKQQEIETKFILASDGNPSILPTVLNKFCRAAVQMLTNGVQSS